MSKGGGLNLFGGSSTTSDTPTPFEVWQKECADNIALTNEIWSQKMNIMQTMAQTREVDVREKFGLYKTQRDLYDVLNERYAQKFNDLDRKAALESHLNLLRKVQKIAKDKAGQREALMNEYIMRHSDKTWTEFMRYKKGSTT